MKQEKGRTLWIPLSQLNILIQLFASWHIDRKNPGAHLW